MKTLFSTLITILIIGTIGHISSDIYLPSLPAISQYFQAQPDKVQLTLAIYLFGFAVSHLFFGPLSDHIGRRRTLQIGLSISALATYLCMLTPSLTWLLVGRFFQGFGMGATGLSRAILRDCFEGPQLAKMASYLSTMVSFMIAIGPTLGGHLQEWLGWRANFGFLALYITGLLIYLTLRLPETNRFIATEPLSVRRILANYRTLLTSRVFIGYNLCAGFTYAGLMSYITITPFLLQTVVGLTPAQFGWLAVFSAAALAAGAYLNSYYVSHVGIHRMMLIGFSLKFSAGLWLLITGLLHIVSAPAIVLGFMTFVFGGSLTFANTTSGAFQTVAKMAGTAAALFGCLQIIIGSLSSGLAALLPEKDQIPIAVLFLAVAILNFLSLRFLVRYHTQ